MKVIFALLHVLAYGFLSVQARSECNSYSNKPFQEIFVISSINYTWESQSAYLDAVNSGRYNPKNYHAYDIEVYGGMVYLALPRSSDQNLVTLASFPLNSSMYNPLLKPYPSCAANHLQGGNCSNLQNVLAIAVDTKGVLWVVDGKRDYNPNGCPPKLVLLDLNNAGNLLHTYIFPDSVTPMNVTWLNQIVIDETDGGFAYIVDSTDSDPGIIVYSRAQDASWKFRDRSMFAEPNAAGITIHGVRINDLVDVSGIALDPSSMSPRKIVYSAFTAYTLYALTTDILKNSSLVLSYSWRLSVEVVGRKCSRGNGMIMDEKSSLYFGMMARDSIGKWDIQKGSFNQEAVTLYTNHTTIDSPDKFAIDCEGNLYVLNSGHEKMYTPHPYQNPPPIRILRRHIGAKSYLY